MTAALHIENPMVHGLMAHLMRDEAREAAAEQAHAILKAEIIDALLTDPRQEVGTPGFSPTVMEAQAVVHDMLSGDDGAQLACRILCVLGLAAQGKLDGLHVLASAVVCEIADAHAAFHAGDMADAMRGEA